tara:strand:- start:2029 stop:2472 length:444 start_codon:yes stop_codon:yes gene_type:complete
MTQFDPDVFLNTEIEGAMETKFTPVPAGEHEAFIDDIAMREVNDTPVLRVTWKVPNEALAAELGVDDIQVNDDLFLDIEADGRLMFGPNKNIKLGRLREALGQNKPGETWGFSQLRGAGPTKLIVSHNYSKSGEGPFARVDKYLTTA